MNEPLRIRTLDQLWMVTASGAGLLIADNANGQVFHPRPDSCPHVTAASFHTKVIVNGGRNGAYYLIESFEQARSRWPRVRTCGSRMCGEDPSARRSGPPLALALDAATGSAEVRERSEPPVGAEALMPGWDSAQRIALGRRDDRLVLCAWPGELRAQARAFYGSDRAERTAALIERDPAWRAVPRPHLAFNGSRPGDRFYFRCSIPVAEYLASWSLPENLEAVGGHDPESVSGELWSWLCGRGFADPGDPDSEIQLQRFMESLRRRRSQAHLRPGIELERRCESAVEDGASQLQVEVTALVRELATALREPLD